VTWRIARTQGYLPDDLHALVKERGLHASQLFQEAVRSEVRRLELGAEAQRYVDELLGEVGPPTSEEAARAEVIVKRLERNLERRTG